LEQPQVAINNCSLNLAPGAILKRVNTQKEFTMKRRFFVVLAVVPLLAAGCASLVDAFSGETQTIDESTTVINSSGAYSWAAMLDKFARGDADSKASRQRQVTRQQTVWKLVGYDYEFNSGELKVGIAEGKYKLGESQYRTNNLLSTQLGGSILGTPYYVYPVYLKTTENVTDTVTEVDKDLWQKTYAESITNRRNWINSKLDNLDWVPAEEYASPVRKKVMARLEKRLREDLLPGTELVYGGWSGGKYEQENVLYAWLEDDGSFMCVLCK
jgi:hypothetical protein